MKNKYFISILFTFLVAIAIPSSISWAEVDYPTKPIEAICPFSAGGGFDSILRAMAPVLEKELGQKIVVVNRTGAGGMVAHGYLAKSKPDGYTILQTGMVKLAFHTEKLDFTEEDLVPIIQWAEATHFFSVRADSPWKSMKDVVQYARANPGKLRVGHIGRTNTLYLTLMGLVRQENIEIIDIPFKGDMPILTSLLNGDVDVASAGLLAFNRDDCRLIMTNLSRRFEAAPDVPTYKETFGIDPAFSALKDVIFVPKGTPDMIVKKLHDAFRKTIEDKNVKKAFLNAGFPVVYRNTKEIQQCYKEDIVKMVKIMKELGMIK